MTVLGPVPADQLGITLPHEHLLCDLARVTGYREHRLSEVSLAITEARRYREAGGTTLVDLTNHGLGRNPTALRQIARGSGLQIIMGCGWYREPYYEQEVYEKPTNQIADEIVRDITEGVDNTGIQAGIIGEIGCQRHYISPAEERSFRAAARAQKRTGLTISTHATDTPVGLDQLDLLEDEDIDLRRVIVSHCDTYPEPDYHEALAKRGAWVEFDFVRGGYEWEMEKEARLVKEFLSRGYLRQLLLSHDVCLKAHLHAYGGAGYDYILTNFVPRLLETGLSNEQIHILTVENPKSALTGI